tara:strand:+ start:677 stop:811 length:135 start_codon:yes stop_codon:yes gene_type:complete
MATTKLSDVKKIFFKLKRAWQKYDLLAVFVYSENFFAITPNDCR